MDPGAAVVATLAGIIVALALAVPMFVVWLAAQDGIFPKVVASVGLLIPPAIGVMAASLVARGDLLAGLVAPLVGEALAAALWLGSGSVTDRVERLLHIDEGPYALELWVLFLLVPTMAVGAMLLASAVL